MITFHGKQDVKDFYLNRLRAHAAADEIVKGVYWEKGRGCAVGCAVHSSSHAAYETEMGIPRMLARLEDRIFEGMPNAEAKLFPVRFIEAIPMGADLLLVGWKFLHWLVADVNERHGTTKTKAGVADAIEVLRRKADGENVSLDEAQGARRKASAASAYASAASAYASAADAYAYAASASAYAASASTYASAAADAAYAAADADAAYASASAYAASAAADAASASAYAASASASASASADAAYAAADADAASAYADADAAYAYAAREKAYSRQAEKLLELLAQAPVMAVA